jgi:mono/diheme cytochrome c family protein
MQDPDRIDYHESPDITEVHAPTKREFSEPSANVTPLPMWLTGVCAAVMVWAGTYFGVFHGGLSGNVYNEYESSPEKLFGLPATAKGPGAGGPAAAQTLAEQGKAVFGNCVVCHQAGGTGVAGQFPPLAGSEWVNGSEKRLVAILLKGLTGPITVQGAQHSYSGNMVGWETALSDKKIAAVASYIRSQWGNQGPEISEAKVAAAKKEFAGQKAQWKEAELLQIPADATLPDAGGAPAPPAGAPAAAPAAAATAPAATAPPAAAAAPAGGAFDLKASIERGKPVFMQTCVACHQPTGMGIPGAFPPLAQTDYTTGDVRRMVAMLLKGVQGPLKVKEVTYNNIMLPLDVQFPILKDDGKLADVINYVRNSFGNQDPKGVTPEVVGAARKEFAARTTPWTEAELLAFPAPSGK